MISKYPGPKATEAGEGGPSLQGVTTGRAPASNALTALIDANFTDAMLASIKRKQLSDLEILQFREPLGTRMRANLLAQESLQSFITHAAQGGIPLKAFQDDPLLPLDEKLTSSLVQGEWLPPYLKERIANPAADFEIQQERIIGVMQRVMKEQRFSLPLFFLGSSAVPENGLPNDIDIGTSRTLRNVHMQAYDDATTAMREAMASDRLILGNKSHIGAVFDQMVLSLGVSVVRYGRALRVTPDVVYAIERNEPLAG